MSRGRMLMLVAGTALLSAAWTSCPPNGPPPPAGPPFELTADAPEGMEWVTCRGGSGQASIKTVGPTGDTLVVGENVLRVPSGAVDIPTIFVLFEPYSDQIVVNAYAEGVAEFPDSALSLSINWQDRGCVIPERETAPVVARVVRGEAADVVEQFPAGALDRGTVTVRLRSLSTFSIAR